MYKKILTFMLVLSILGAISVTMSVAATETNLVVNGSFEELKGDGTLVAGSTPVLSGAATLQTNGGKDGNNYVSLVSGSVALTQSVSENLNYKMSFWSKTSVYESIRVTMYPKGPGWTEWTDYCNTNGIPYNATTECFADFNTGVTQSGGSDWMEVSYEFHVPHDCVQVLITIQTNSVSDAYRAVDAISVVQMEEENLVVNGSFDFVRNIDANTNTPSTKFPTHWVRAGNEYSDWKCALAYETEENGNHYATVGTSNSINCGSLQQQIGLYAGNYELSFRKKCSIQALRVWLISSTGVSNFANTMSTNRRLLALDSRIKIDTWEDYKIYFTVTTQGMFNFGFGYVNGVFSVDDIKLKRIGGAAVGFYNETAIRAINNTGSGNADFCYVPIEDTVAAQTVKVFGWIAPNSEVSTVKIIYAVYKKQQDMRTLYSLSSSEQSTGTTYINQSVSVPADTETETYELKAMIWDDFNGLLPIAEAQRF